jgi:hypothetical protein
MTKRDLDPDILARRIKQSSPGMSSEQARRISEDSCRRVDAEKRSGPPSSTTTPKEQKQ